MIIKLGRSVINSKRRFTYEEVQEIIEKENGDFCDDIMELELQLHKPLRKKRLREGSIDFFSPEIKFELG